MLYLQIDDTIQRHESWVLRRQRNIPNNRGLLVVTCMDERIPIEQVLGINPGDAHIFRNAGGLITADTLRSAILTTNFFGTKEVVIVNHTECGMMSASKEDILVHLENVHESNPQALPIEPGLEELGAFPNKAAFATWFRMFEDVDEACLSQVELLKGHPFIPKDVAVNGYVYEVETGHLRRPLGRLSERVNSASQMRVGV